MDFIIVSIIFCVLFTILIPVRLVKNPIDHIMSYPKSVRERARKLKQYENTIKQIEKKHIAVKIVSIFLFVVILSFVIYVMGRRSFSSAFLYSYGLFTVVNLYDLIILDLIWFPNSKKARIQGTEDMEQEYRDKMFHFIGFLKGCVIGLIVSLFASGLVVLMNKILK